MRDVPAEAFFLYAKWKVESPDEELAAKSLTGEIKVVVVAVQAKSFTLIYGGLPKLRG